MSIYQNLENGLMMGLDNGFAYRDADGTFHVFPVIVYVRPYEFDQPHWANISIRTPAQQLIWKPVPFAEPWGLGGEEGSIPKIHYILTEHAQRWLDKNAPGWAVDPAISDERNPEIFFEEQEHAIEFDRWVGEMLKGMTLKDYS